MPLTLDATVAGAAANSYCTRAEADTYHEARLFATAWTGASNADKDIALVMATRVLDQLFEWESYATTTTQALAWPRAGVLDYHERELVDSMTLPQQLKEATAELARQLIVADRTLDSDVETQGLLGLTAGPVSLQFKDGVRAKVIPDAVKNYIPSWWGHLKSGNLFRDLVRT